MTKVYGMIVLPNRKAYVSASSFKTDVEAGDWLTRMKQIYPDHVPVADHLMASMK